MTQQLHHAAHWGAFSGVVEDGRLVGVVSARDALGPELEDFIYALLRQQQMRATHLAWAAPRIT